MQLALVEFARHVLKIEDANSSEFDDKCSNPIVYLIDEFMDASGKKQIRTAKTPLGGTMRLGSYECKVKPNSLLAKVYNNAKISKNATATAMKPIQNIVKNLKIRA